MKDAYTLYKSGAVRKALVLYLRAAMAGYEVGLTNAAYILIRHSDTVPFVCGPGAEKQKNCGRRMGELLLQRAFAQGSSEAAVTLAEMARTQGHSRRAAR